MSEEIQKALAEIGIDDIKYVEINEIRHSF